MNQKLSTMLEAIMDRRNVEKALLQVERNKGVGGVDGMQTDELRVKHKISLKQIEENMKYTIILMHLFLFSCSSKKYNENLNGKTNLEYIDKFDLFFKKFASDSLFQINRIKFPLDFEYYEDYDDEMTIIKIDFESWLYIDFSDDSLASDYLVDAYNILFESKDENKMEYIREGIDNGINVIYHFEFLEEQWFLVKITDKSS